MNDGVSALVHFSCQGVGEIVRQGRSKLVIQLITVDSLTVDRRFLSGRWELEVVLGHLMGRILERLQKHGEILVRHRFLNCLHH